MYYRKTALTDKFEGLCETKGLEYKYMKSLHNKNLALC
jgi:hypothetical protein